MNGTSLVRKQRDVCGLTLGHIICAATAKVTCLKGIIPKYKGRSVWLIRKRPLPYFKAGAEAIPAPISADNISTVGDNIVRVNLRYYQRRQECFSQWQKDDLKGFSKWVEHVSQKRPEQVTSVTKTCHAHVGITQPLPASISRDVRMYGFDVGRKARVHGFFAGIDLFIVWLDRNHSI